MIQRIYLIIFGMFVAVAVTPCFARNIVELAIGEWPPFHSEKLPHYGVLSRVVTESFAVKGYTVKYKFFPWARSYREVEVGNSDGTACWVTNKKRESLFFVSKPVARQKYVFFHLKSYPFDWKTLNDLKNLRIGITIKYFYGNEFHSAIKKGLLTVESRPSDEWNFKKLIAKRINIFPNEMIAGYELLKTSFSQKEAELITHHPQPLNVGTLHVLFSKKISPQKVSAFNEGLETIILDGRYQQFIYESLGKEIGKEIMVSNYDLKNSN